MTSDIRNFFLKTPTNTSKKNSSTVNRADHNGSSRPSEISDQSDPESPIPSKLKSAVVKTKERKRTKRPFADGKQNVEKKLKTDSDHNDDSNNGDSDCGKPSTSLDCIEASPVVMKKPKKQKKEHLKPHSAVEVSPIVHKTKSKSKRALSPSPIIVLDESSEEAPMPRRRSPRKLAMEAGAATTSPLKATTPPKSKPEKRKRVSSPSNAIRNPEVLLAIERKNLKPVPVAMKPVSANDFFSAIGPVVVKKKTSPIKKQVVLKEQEDHSDEEFMNLLANIESTPSCSASTATNGTVAPSKNDHTEVRQPSAASPAKSKIEDAPIKLAMNCPKSPVVVQKSSSQATPKEKQTKKPAVREDNAGAEAKKPKLVSHNKSGSFGAFMHREGPQEIGSVDIPEGKPGCLKNLTFVITGIIEFIDRDDLEELLKKCGARITQSISKKTNYLVSGRDCGASKMAKAEDLKVETIDGEQLLELIRKKSGSVAKSTSVKLVAESAANVESLGSVQEGASHYFASDAKNEQSSKEKEPTTSTCFTAVSPGKVVDRNEVIVPDSQSSTATSSAETRPISDTAGSSEQQHACELWVDKYRPKSVKNIVGQLGNQSCVSKLINWLTNWQKWHGHGGAVKTAPRFGASDGSNCRAALLSGPPGVGKTTTAHLACKELGISFIEMNASDCRSKKLLEGTISSAVDNFAFSSTSKGKAGLDMRVIIMDEVDGMAGNEDRSGMQELICLIKKTRVPIIAICNDRQHRKIRALSNHCFDLRFMKPRVETIRAAMLSICFKEGVKVAPAVIDQLIETCNRDIRQTIHNLSTLCVDKANHTTLEDGPQFSDKNSKLNPFDACKMLFTENDQTKSLNLNEKAEKFFFVDYNLMPVMIQENYPHAQLKDPKATRLDRLRALSDVADNLIYGDIIEKQIRSNSSWGLLPTLSMFSAVLPGERLRGGIPSMVNFPTFLGKYSKRTRLTRLSHEILQHMSLEVGGCDARSLVMDYLPVVRMKLGRLLAAENVADVVDFCGHHSLVRDDVESLFELTQFDGRKDLWSKVPGKTKAALTKSLNKSSVHLPFAVDVAPSKKRKVVNVAPSELALDGEGNAIDDADKSDESDSEQAAPLPKPKSKTTSKKAATTTKKPTKPRKK